MDDVIIEPFALASHRYEPIHSQKDNGCLDVPSLVEDLDTDDLEEEEPDCHLYILEPW